MSATNHPKADFTRTCDICKFAIWGGISPRCGAAKHLVTGQPFTVDAIAARSPKGHCGPAGKRWEPLDEPITINEPAPVVLPPARRQTTRIKPPNGATVASMLILAILAAWTPEPAAAQYAPTFRSEPAQWHWTHHRHRHYDDGCKPFVTVVGDQYASIDGAKSEADKAWQQTVRWKFGERFMDRTHADDVTYECGRSSVGSVLNQVFYRCSIKARPCRPDRK